VNRNRDNINASVDPVAVKSAVFRTSDDGSSENAREARSVSSNSEIIMSKGASKRDDSESAVPARIPASRMAI